MEALLKISLFIHVAAGFSALISGLVAIFSTKGAKTHILSGRVYFWGMVIVALTAVILAVFKELTFLFSIAVFSFYLTFTGFKSVKDKAGNANWLDWSIMFLTLLVSSYMLYTRDVILVVFGAISIIMIYSDFRFFRQSNHSKQAWLFRHIGKMSGAYIATVTAFLVTNVHFLPQLAVWLLPTVIGSPIIAYTIRKYKLKFAAKHI